MRYVLLVTLLLALAGSAHAARKKTADLVNDLRDGRTRTAAYRELLKRKDPKAVYPIQGLLPELDTTGQYYGVLILAATGTKTADDALRTVTKLGDPHLRVTAGAALYRKGDRAVVLSMADALLTKDVPSPTRTLMIRRLYAVREPAIAAAVGRLLAADGDHLVLYYALHLLHTQEAWRIAPQAVRLLEDKRAAVRALGSAFLLRFGLEEYAGPAAKAIRDGKLDRTWWGRVRFYIVAAPRVAPDVLSAIAARLPDEADRSIVLSMIHLLGQEEHRPGARALRRRIGDGDRTIAGAAFDALLKIPGGLTREKLAERLQDPEPAIRLKAVDALRRHDDRSALPVAAAILADGAPADRRAAALVIGKFRSSSAVEPLLRALEDSRPA
ncbi:MAG: HEAT repeat domain-containing protein, partial [Planctomycetota bacterium]